MCNRLGIGSLPSFKDGKRKPKAHNKGSLRPENILKLKSTSPGIASCTKVQNLPMELEQPERSPAILHIRVSVVGPRRQRWRQARSYRGSQRKKDEKVIFRPLVRSKTKLNCHLRPRQSSKEYTKKPTVSRLHRSCSFPSIELGNGGLANWAAVANASLPLYDLITFIPCILKQHKH